MYKTFSVAALIATTFTAAHAAGPAEPIDPIVVAPAPPVSPFWAGGYVGAQLGYAYGNFDFGSLNIDDFDDDSVIGGLTAGYLWEVSPGWYLGPEFQYDWADISVQGPDWRLCVL